MVFYSKQSTLKISDQILDKIKGIVGTDFKKLFLNWTLAALNSPLYRVSFQTKHCEVSVSNLPKKGILGTKRKKTIVEFEVSAPEYLLVRIFILNIAHWSLQTKFAQKDILTTKLRKIIVEYKISSL